MCMHVCSVINEGNISYQIRAFNMHSGSGTCSITYIRLEVDTLQNIDELRCQ